MTFADKHVLIGYKDHGRTHAKGGGCREKAPFRKIFENNKI